MQKRLDDLYHGFCNKQDFTKSMLSVEESNKDLISKLTEADGKAVLRIIDELEMICNYQSKASFIQGFGLGMELTTELQNYKGHSLEKQLNDCGQFFMPKGEIDVEKENYHKSSISSNHFSAADYDAQPATERATNPRHKPRVRILRTW